MITFLISFINNYLNIEPSNNIIIENNKIIINQYGSYTLTILKNIFLNVSLWGAGGGFNGGKGGFSSGLINFTKNEKYILWVGQGGIKTKVGGSNSFGGGGFVGKVNHNSLYVGTGGGLTGIFQNSVLHENSLIIAGGGGGSGNQYLGGGGGGLNGLKGSDCNNNERPGMGGTQIWRKWWN